MGPDINIKTQRICRACLAVTDSVKDLIDLFGGNDLIQIYTQCTSLPLARSDGLSEFICLDCHQKFQTFYQFRVGCIDAYNYLNEQYLNNELVIDSDMLQVKIKKTEIACSTQNQMLTAKQELEDEKDCDYDVFLGESVDNDDDNYTYAQMDDSIDKLDENNPHDDDERDGDQINNVVGTKKIVSSENATAVDNDDEDPTDRAKLICDICQKSFFKKHRLEGHMRQHRGLKQWDCDQCDKSYAKWTTFQAHKRFYHGNDDDKIHYKCEYAGCDKAYPMKVRMNRSCSAI